MAVMATGMVLHHRKKRWLPWGQHRVDYPTGGLAPASAATESILCLLAFLYMTCCALLNIIKSQVDLGGA